MCCDPSFASLVRPEQHKQRRKQQNVRNCYIVCMQEAISDLTEIVQMDPANLEAHNILHTVRDKLHAEARHSVTIGGLYA